MELDGPGYSVSGTIGVAMKTQADALTEKIKAIASSKGANLPVSIKCKFGVGDVVPPIDDITPLKEEGGQMVEKDNVTFAHKEGEVILL